MPVTKQVKVISERIRFAHAISRLVRPGRQSFCSTSFLSLLTLLCTSVCFSQTLDPESNWSKETGRHDDWYTHFDFRRYSEEDVLAAKSKFLLIKVKEDLDEWEGEYRQGVMLGAAELIWSRKDGFVKAYMYHTLNHIDYGRSSAERDVVTFKSEKPVKNVRKNGGGAFAFVKFGTVHYLVPVDKLSDFAARAAGLKRAKSENDYSWIKAAEWDHKVSGLPKFPAQFAHLIKQPITAKIVSIGAPRLRQDKFESGEVYAEYRERFITVSKGTTSGIKVGMEFFVEEWGEWIEIRSVGARRSVAVLSRSLSDTKTEVCWVDEALRETERPCSDLNVGTGASTKSREFDF